MHAFLIICFATAAAANLQCLSKDSSSSLHAATGRLHYRTLDKAVEKFRAADSEDARLLVASGINVQKWMDGALSHRHRQVCFEVEFSDDTLNENTTGNLYALKTKDPEHYEVTSCLGFAVTNYSQLEWPTQLMLFGARLCRNVVCSGRVRQPDFAIHSEMAPGIKKYSEYPCLVAEIEFERRSLSTAHRYCIEHFKLIPSLNVAMLFKFFSRRPGTRRFAALAVIYCRAADGPIVSDAVSFGMCPLPPNAVVPNEIARVLRVLPDAPCPFPRDYRQVSEATPTISVSSELVLGPSFAKWCGEPGREGNTRAPGPLVVELWHMLSHVEWSLNDAAERASPWNWPYADDLRHGGARR
jgi:hypothetical protein